MLKLLSFILLFPVAAIAQTATLSGSITAGTSPITGAQVNLISPSTKDNAEVKYGALTNTGGKYNIDGIAPGTYTLVVAAQGYKPEVTNGFVVEANKAQVVDRSLSQY